MHDAETPAILRDIERKADFQTRLVILMSLALDALKAQVKANTDVTNSAVALIKGLADQIIALKDDPAALEQLAADMKSSDDALSAAVAANTAAAP